MMLRKKHMVKVKNIFGFYAYDTTKKKITMNNVMVPISYMNFSKHICKERNI